ncbi:MAG: DotI/IcmL/TraM family protein [Pseudomonadota bacterium]|nr:DotI/IcmL/TraM family protein [Pseudomonadota bacterium]
MSKQNQTKLKNKSSKKADSPESSAWLELLKEMNPADVQIITRIFYRDGYRLMFKALLITLVVFAVYVVSKESTEEGVQYKYFAQKPNGQFTEITPLDKPNLSKRAIINWTMKAIPIIYSFDFKNHERHFEGTGHLYFTDQGSLAMKEGLKRGNPSTISIVEDKKYVVTTTLAGQQAVVEKAGKIGDLYAWQVAVPVYVTYENIQEKKLNKRIARVTIVRTPEIETPEGIGITKFALGSAK